MINDMSKAALDTLNEMFKLDPQATDALLQLCVPVNQTLADHPTIQCHSKTSDGKYPVLRFIGLLNGILGAAGCQLIASQYDEETKCLVGFQYYDPPTVGNQ